MKNKLRAILLIILVIAAVNILPLFVGGDVELDAKAPDARPARVYAPLPEGCPRGYARLNEAECWNANFPTPAPYPSPTGTLVYFPTITPSAAPATVGAPEVGP
jgi:hypothetical protein